MAVDGHGGIFVTGISTEVFRTAKFVEQPAPGKPRIIQSPQSHTLLAGSTIALTVCATGDALLTYQWLYTGRPLSGATNASLILTPVLPSAAGCYSVIVSNALGTVESPAAELQVLLPDTPHTVHVIYNGGSGCHLTVCGEPGHSYAVEYSTNLVHWDRLPSQHNATGILYFTDPDISHKPQCFYRAVKVD